MQGIAFYAELLGFIFVVFGIPAALYCFLGAFIWRDFKQVYGVLITLGIWVLIFILKLQIVPSGEVRSIQYTGGAALMQILFFFASAMLLSTAIKTLRQQTRKPK